jgi:hypothetical protein
MKIKEELIKCISASSNFEEASDIEEIKEFERYSYLIADLRKLKFLNEGRV